MGARKTRFIIYQIAREGENQQIIRCQVVDQIPCWGEDGHVGRPAARTTDENIVRGGCPILCNANDQMHAQSCGSTTWGWVDNTLYVTALSDKSFGWVIPILFAVRQSPRLELVVPQQALFSSVGGRAWGQATWSWCIGNIGTLIGRQNAHGTPTIHAIQHETFPDTV